MRRQAQEAAPSAPVNTSDGLEVARAAVRAAQRRLGELERDLRASVAAVARAEGDQPAALWAGDKSRADRLRAEASTASSAAEGLRRAIEHGRAQLESARAALQAVVVDRLKKTLAELHEKEQAARDAMRRDDTPTFESVADATAAHREHYALAMDLWNITGDAGFRVVWSPPDGRRGPTSTVPSPWRPLVDELRTLTSNT